MADKDDFADELARQMRNEAERRGIDPSLVQKEDVQVDRDNANIHIRWKDVDIAMPAPSREAISGWFAQNDDADQRIHWIDDAYGPVTPGTVRIGSEVVKLPQ